MSIALTALFTRMGKIASLYRAVNLFRGTGALQVVSLTGNGSTSTVTTLAPHGFTNGDTVAIAGAANTTWNSIYTITVTSTTAFTITSSVNATDTSKSITATKTAGVGTWGSGPYFDSIAGQFTNTDQNLINQLYSFRDSYRTVHSSLQQSLVSLCQSILVQTANEDSPLSSQDPVTALGVLISQMLSGSQSVKAPTVTVTVTAGGSNNTNGVCVASVKNPKGVQLDYAFAESLTVTCISDSQGNATLGSEQMSIVGPAAEPDVNNWDYPLGSGTNTQITAVDASLSVGQNVLANSSFDTYSVTNVPDGWTIQVGTAGTTVLNGGSGSAFVQTGSCLQIAGNGAELTKVYEPFSAASTAAGTTYKILPRTVYAVNLWTKVSAIPGAGVLRVALVDGNDSIITDDAGNSNSITISLPGESNVAYTAHNAFFRTPAIIPSTVRIRLDLTTALDNGKSVYLDHLAMTPATQVYPGGPYVAVFSGSNKFVINDTYTVKVVNDYAGEWVSFLDRAFGLRSLGYLYQIPSSGSPSINDNLIA